MLRRLMRAIAKKVLWLYIGLMDKIISSFVGGDQSPAFFYAPKIYPDLLRIDENYQKIRDELAPLLPRTQSMGLIHETIKEHPEIPGWRVLYIHVIGMRDFPNRELFAHTVAILDSIPNVVDAWFSVLEPRKSIPAHRGIYRGFLRYHTAFKVPENNPPRLRVKDEFYTWKEGESVMFDDRHEHEVYNDSADSRLVLIVDVMRPLPWFLHIFNLLAVRILCQLAIKPSLRRGTLGLKGDLWEGPQVAG